MKNCLQILFLSILSPLMSRGQIAIDYDCQLEVSKIILNYKRFGVKEFKVRYKNQFNKHRQNKDLFKYQFVNDTILKHIHKGDTLYFKFKDGEFIKLKDTRDSLWDENYRKDKEYKSKDSSGFKINSIYRITKFDTLLIFEYSIKLESNLKIEINKFLSDTIYHMQKIITTKLSDSSQKVQSFFYKNNHWLKNFEYVETETQNGNENTVITTSFDFTIADDNSEKLIRETIAIRRTNYFYNEKGLIKKVEIIKECGLFNEIMTLDPIRIK